MYTGDARRRLSHLWQLPLLFASIVLFVCAAVLFVEGRPKITLNQKLSQARAYLRDDRPDAAAESIARLLAAEKFPREVEGQIHLALAEALDAAQKQRPQVVPAVPIKILEETQIALAQGVQPTGKIYRRMGENLEALGKPVEAVAQYRQAIAMDPSRAIRLQRKVIDLQLASSDWAPAEASIDAYLAAADIADTERAWAKMTKAQLLIDRGDFVDAKRLLDEAIALDPSEIAQAEARYRLGVCAWKLGNLDDAQKLIATARASFRGQHPLDADAAYALGKIAMERNDAGSAAVMFDAVITTFPQSSVAPLARMSRGVARIQKGDDEPGLFDLRIATENARATPALREDALIAIRKASALLSGKANQQAAIELLACEQSLENSPSAGFFARLADAYEKRAEQIEQSIPDATPAEKLRREQLLRESYEKAANAHLAYSRALLAANEKAYGEAMWKAMSLYDRAANPQAVAGALELFVTEKAADPLAPDALLRLGRTYEAMSQVDKAIAAYQRLESAYAKSPAALQAAVPLAMLYIGQGPGKFSNAESVLLSLADGKPEGDEYKRALFELGMLYHRTDRPEKALPRLELFAQKFTGDPRAASATFFAAECYRMTAQEIEVQLAGATVNAADDKSGAEALAKAAETKKYRLVNASRLYEQATQLYGAAPQPQLPAQARGSRSSSDRRQAKLAALRRADCDYELGRYSDAVGRYKAVVSSYPNDPVALAASVQIVNCYTAMNRLDEARAASEQARRLLETMPQAALEPGSGNATTTTTNANTTDGAGGATSVMSKTYFEQWLKWTGTPAASTY